MKQNIQIASKCFLENLARFGGEANPENYNLYNGLANLAGAVATIQSEIAALKEEIGLVKRLVSGRR